MAVQSGLDPDKLNLSTSRDYVLVLPPQGIHGTIWINGGHNVVLIGGEITVPSSANQTDNGADDTDTAIYVQGSTGTVHIEGVLINADPNVMFDGIDVNAPGATVDVENVRMENVYGSSTTEHADVIQTWGGASALRVDHLTAAGDYQGLTIAPALGTLGMADIRNVDLTLTESPAALAATTTGGGYMIWLTEGTTTCNSSPASFTNVYVANEADHVANSNTVWPPSTAALPCRSTLSADEVSWPGLPITGAVTLGSPTAGPFVPAGTAGNKYQSPGYAPR